MSAEGEGTARLLVIYIDGKYAYIEVAALHCLTARHNLLSVSGALQGGWKTTLDEDSGRLQGRSKKQVEIQFDK
jgi:hypothetical protein